MLHSRRRFQVQDVTSIELAHKIGTMSWTLCSGFRHGGYLWLNDAFSEDSIQEYAIIRESDLVQVESLTASWMKPFDLMVYAQDMANRECIWSDNPKPAIQRDRIENVGSHGRCPLCA